MLQTAAALAAMSGEFKQAEEYQLSYLEMAEDYRTGATELSQTFDTGAEQVSPAVTIRYKALDKARALAAEFGLTPSARARLSIERNDDDDISDLLED